MATVFKRPGSPFWFACYSDQNGKTVRRSTKAMDKTTASRMALEWEELERAAKEGRATATTFQRVVSDISKRAIGEGLSSQTTREYLTEWLSSIRQKATVGTQKRYEATVRQFLKVLDHIADQPLRGLMPRHIELFLNTRLDGGAAPKTAIVDIMTLGSALQRAERYGVIDKNPVPAVKLPKSVSSEREVFTMDEIGKLVNAAPNLDWKTLIYLGAFTGARLGDCIELTWDNIDTENAMISYTQKKTGKGVVLPVHRDLLHHLHALSESGTLGPLCRSLAKQKRSGSHGLSEGFKRIVVRAGLDLRVVKGKGTRNFARRTFHSLRHTFSSVLANQGVSEEMRMKLTGHSSREMHQRYSHHDNKTLQKAMDSMPGTAKP